MKNIETKLEIHGSTKQPPSPPFDSYLVLTDPGEERG